MRILVVDDFEPFRRYVSAMLQESSEFTLVGEAPDGLEATQQAYTLRPDVIVLDIQLPKLNGLEAARQIREVSSESKIVFVTQCVSAAVAQEAFADGAEGYVIKSDVARELLPALRTVCNGEVFVSSRLAGQVFDDFMDDHLVRGRAVISTAEVSRRHEVAFYRDETSLAKGFTHCIENNLKDDCAVMLVATKSHRESVDQLLIADGVNVGAVIEQGIYIPLDPGDLLPAFMIGDLPDADLFAEFMSNLITAASKSTNTTVESRPRRVVACGECAPTLLAAGKAQAAVQLEHLWDEVVVRSYGANVYCGYLSSSFYNAKNVRIFEGICAEHSAVHAE